jgi:hypothetical protein
MTEHENLIQFFVGVLDYMGMVLTAVKKKSRIRSEALKSTPSSRGLARSCTMFSLMARVTGKQTEGLL